MYYAILTQSTVLFAPKAPKCAIKSKSPDERGPIKQRDYEAKIFLIADLKGIDIFTLRSLNAINSIFFHPLSKAIKRLNVCD